MKNNILTFVAALAIFFFIKKGSNSANENKEDLNFFETIKRGFDLTIKSLTESKNEGNTVQSKGQPGYVTDKPNDAEMVSFSGINSSFPGYTSKMKKSRGLFHLTTIHRGN